MSKYEDIDGLGTRDTVTALGPHQIANPHIVPRYVTANPPDLLPFHSSDPKDIIKGIINYSQDFGNNECS